MMNIIGMLTVHQTRLATSTLISTSMPGCDTRIRMYRTCTTCINMNEHIGCRFFDLSGASAVNVNGLGALS
jgi:hypothetical protein